MADADLRPETMAPIDADPDRDAGPVAAARELTRREDDAQLHHETDNWAF